MTSARPTVRRAIEIANHKAIPIDMNEAPAIQGYLRGCVFGGLGEVPEALPQPCWMRVPQVY
jgi:hypothetical protein